MSEPIIGKPPWEKLRDALEKNIELEARIAELEKENTKLKAVIIYRFATKGESNGKQD